MLTRLLMGRLLPARGARARMSRNAVPSFAAMATVLVTVLVLGVFIPIVQATTGAANEVRGRVLVNVYLKTDRRQADVERVRAARGHARTSATWSTSPRAGLRRAAPALPRGLRAAGLQPAARHVPRHARRARQRAQAARRARPADAGRRAHDGRPGDRRGQELPGRHEKILVATRVVKLTTGAAGAVLLVIASILLDLEHDPAVALRAPARGRGHEARGRDGLVHPLAVRHRGRGARRAGRSSRSCCCSSARSRSSTRSSTSSRCSPRRTRSTSACSSRCCCWPRVASARRLRPLAAPLPARLALRGPLLSSRACRALPPPIAPGRPRPGRRRPDRRDLARRAALVVAARPRARRARRRRGHGRGRGGDRRRRRTPTTARSPTTSSPTPRSTASSNGSTTASRRTSTPRSTGASRSPEQRVLRGRGAGQPAPARPARRGRLRRARRPSAPGIEVGDVIVERGRRSLAGRPQDDAVSLIKGPPGAKVRLAWLRRAGGSRAGGHAQHGDGARRRVVAAPRRELRRGRRAAGAVHLRRARRGLRGPAPAAQARRRRPTSWTCAATAAAWSTRRSSSPAPSSRTGRSSRRAGARCRAHAARDRRAGRSPRRRRSCSSTADGVGVGDRGRRAAGPRPRDRRRDEDLRQGRLPGGPRALQRRRAGHHRRPVLPAQRAQPRRAGHARAERASRPTSAAADDPETRRDEALARAAGARRAGKCR